VHNIVWNLFELTPALMFIALSVDRLLLVSSPLWYIKQTWKYAVMIVGAVFAYGFIGGIVGLYYILFILLHFIRQIDYVITLTNGNDNATISSLCFLSRSQVKEENEYIQ
jgi:hypothetical protein